MLSLRAVNQFYGENHILWNLDLEQKRRMHLRAGSAGYRENHADELYYRLPACAQME